MCHARYDGCCRIVVDYNTNFDVNVELRYNRTVNRRTDRRTNGQTDEWKSGHLCHKVSRSGRCFMQRLMVV